MRLNSKLEEILKEYGIVWNWGAYAVRARRTYSDSKPKVQASTREIANILQEALEIGVVPVYLVENGQNFRKWQAFNEAKDIEADNKDMNTAIMLCAEEVTIQQLEKEG